MKISWVKESIRMSYVFGRSMLQFMRGIYLLSRLPQPIVAIFGGSRAGQDNEWSKQAYQLAYMFAQHGISVITGGGPGIMEAANCGAERAQEKETHYGKTLGIGLRDIDVNFDNPCASVLRVSNFFLRKWFLIRYSIAFVVFPGGIGTADEIFEVFNLLKHGKIKPCPFIFVGSSYWQPLINWYTNSGLKEDFIAPELASLFVVNDNIDEVFRIVYEVSKKV